ncbi:MarR family winged helix-turn-helix transcriptional regulator [Sphingomonas alpina]|uniref:MarR family transcriptional regulator n=1 Tax=Sphingomonas alpina TaxID=653931 RepID=A0A7H0LG60_9SPHN|nr:MarR family transcriptional regulator [Sphingomonas alpina]QNQ08663.1 MarR family transcriptional regulator [Sphingomonas alpina]
MSQPKKNEAMPQSKDCDPRLGNNWLEGYVPYQLYRLTNRLDRRLQTRLRKLGIKPSPWRVMTVLRSHGTLAIGGIAEHSLMEQPTVSRVIVQLEADGLIEREISAEDSRITLVTLTPEGVEKIDTIVAIAHRHQEEALSELSSDEIAQFRAIVARIEQNIDFNQ